MTLKPTQSGSGTQHSKSSNPTKRTGRPDGTDVLRQSKGSDAITTNIDRTEQDNPTKQRPKHDPLHDEIPRGTVRNDLARKADITNVNVRPDGGDSTIKEV